MNTNTKLFIPFSEYKDICILCFLYVATLNDILLYIFVKISNIIFNIISFS